MSSTNNMLPPRVVLALLLCSTSGCYFYFHPPSNRARPRVQPGGRIELRSAEKTERVSCTDLRDDCVYRTGEGRRTKHYTEYTATYDGRKLTEGELRALVDPHYNETWDRIESKTGTCKISLAPTVVAAIGLAVGGIASIYGSATMGKIEHWDNTTKLATYIGAGVAVGAGLLSYPLGGYACVTADGLGAQLDVRYHGKTEMRTDYVNGHLDEAKMAELARLVERFNAKVTATP